MYKKGEKSRRDGIEVKRKRNVKEKDSKWEENKNIQNERD